jgi:hypothetical protein
MSEGQTPGRGENGQALVGCYGADLGDDVEAVDGDNGAVDFLRGLLP